MNAQTPMIIGAVAAILSAIGAGLVRAMMLRLGIVVQPRPDRWHRTPTPTYGGVAILLAVAIALAVVTPGALASLLASAPPESRFSRPAGTTISCRCRR